MGGSVTQYFIGEFDGAVFTPSDAILRMTDFAKDPNGYPRLVQTPMNIEKLRRTLLCEKAAYLPKGAHRDISLPTGRAIELVIRLKVDESFQTDPAISGPEINRFEIAFANDAGEKLSVGYDVPSAQIWLDRSKLRGFDHPFYTGRFAAPVNTALYPDARMLDLHLFLDGCTFEIYANEHLETGTALIYPGKPLDMLRLKADGIGVTIDHFELYTLDKTMCRETL